MAEQKAVPSASASEGAGDQVCWLNLVCDVCGALNEREASVCWRCDIPMQAAG